MLNQMEDPARSEAESTDLRIHFPSFGSDAPIMVTLGPQQRRRSRIPNTALLMRDFTTSVAASQVHRSLNLSNVA